MEYRNFLDLVVGLLTC